MCAYKANIPQATDRIRVSQTDLLNNFTSISTAFGINHVTFDDPTGNQGKHAYVSLPEQAASPATAVDEMAIFSRVGAHSPTASQLCVRRENSGDVIEFTAGTLAVTGWTRLPSGLLIKWGRSTNTGFQTVTFDVAATIPAFTAIYSVQLTTFSNIGGSDSDTFVRLNTYTTTNFTVYCSPRTTTGTKAVTFEYLAIGI